MMTAAVKIRALEEVPDFKARWAGLYERCAGGFFLSPAWIESWVSLAKDRAALFVIEIANADGAQLMGVLSCVPNKMPLLGGQTVRLHEAGDAALDRIYVEYNDFLVAPEASADCRDLAWRAVLDFFTDAESFVVQNALPACREALFRVAGKRQFTCRPIQENRVYKTDLSALREKGETVLSSLSKNTKKQVARSIRLYEEQGPLKLHVAEAANEAAHWQTLVQLHSAVWTARGAAGVFNNPAMGQFHDLLRSQHPDAVQLLELRVGEQPIGSLYNFLQGRTAMNYQSGFQYSEDNRLKPGLVAHVMAAQHYLDHGYDLYDMLAGEQRYKQSLGDEAETLSLIEVERPGLRTQLRQAARFFKARLK